MDTISRMANYGGTVRTSAQYRRIKHKANSRKTHVHQFYDDPDRPGRKLKFRCPQCQPGKLRLVSLAPGHPLGIRDEEDRMLQGPPVEVPPAPPKRRGIFRRGDQ